MMIVKVPGVNGNKECRNAGNSILKESNGLINSKGKVVSKQGLDLEEIHVDNNNLEWQDKLIYENSFKIFSEQDKVFFLGGDHSLSYSTTRAFFDSFPGFLIVFDNFLDLENYEKLPENKSWLKVLIEKYGSENILVVGAGEILGSKEFFNEHKIRIIPLERFTAALKDATEFIMETTMQKPLYVSFDINSVGEEGFSSQQILYIMKRIAMMKNLKALDIVEVPENDKKKVRLAAKILAEFL